ncbi:DNA polymerase-3 subunit gamma/tau [Pedobacter sp. UYP30]|uniref:DNA polymerase III subunit gamma/tau n=1 Tax=Pedobacter sp. UYP30 TaxID=1756400 RepID=UPI00339A0C8C
MENFIVSARKYRPATFETVVGQQHITGTLKNAIKNNQLAQAFLFCGPRGVGKTTCARILAKTINCTNLGADVEACGTCENCLSFQNGNSFNVHELDAASNNSVDDIRSLIEQVRIPPQAGKYKIYIIDEVHMLSASAFNAFLKTLEEPPPYAIFILATTEKHKILPTILSRCQIFDFNRIQVDDIATHLAVIAERENITVDADGLHIIAQKADGGLRDALSMFDQIASYSNKQITYNSVIDNLNILDYDYFFKLTDYLNQAAVSETLLLFDEILNHGFDGNNFINGLASHFRNLLVSKDATTVKLLEVSENIKKRYLQQAQQTALSFLLTGLNLANNCDLNYKTSKNQRLQVELALIKMCHIKEAVKLAQQPIANSQTSADENPDKKKTISVTEGEAKAERIKSKDQSESEPRNDQRPTTNEVEAEIKAERLKTKDQGENKVEAEIKVERLKTRDQSESEPSNDQRPTTNEVEAERPTTDENNSSSTSIKIKKPINAVSSLIPSLTDLQKVVGGDEAEEPKKITGETRNPFSAERLFEVWSNYATQLKADDKINLYTILNSFPPVLKENHVIEVFVESKTQEEMVQKGSIDLLNYLRNTLDNFGIEIIYKRSERKVENRLYGNREKYDYLVAKNPKLDEMRRKFNLDVSP